MTKRDLMAERDKAVAAGDWQRMNELTAQIAALPMAGVAPLTVRDINKYVAGKGKKS